MISPASSRLLRKKRKMIRV